MAKINVVGVSGNHQPFNKVFQFAYKKALEADVNIIGASCLLTITVPELKKIIEELNRHSLRDRFKFMVGGAAVNAGLAREIGADGYGADLKEAVDVALALLKEKKKEGK